MICKRLSLNMSCCIVFSFVSENLRLIENIRNIMLNFVRCLVCLRFVVMLKVCGLIRMLMVR